MAGIVRELQSKGCYHSIMTLKRPFCTLLAGLLLLASPAWPDGLPDLGDASRDDLSPQAERRLGESIMNEIRLREPAYVDDPEIAGYLNRLGGRLVEHSPDAGSDFNFFAIRDDTINAFAMFGGFIGINTGTILTVHTESELAGVMAHEISHVTQHHLARQISRERQMSVPMMLTMALAILAARSNSQAATAAIVSVEAGSLQAQLAYTRDYEREADRVGFQLMQSAGFDVHGMADFFERLQKATRLYENNAPVYLRTHPLNVERLSDMENRAQNASYRQVVDSLDFHLVRAKLRAGKGIPSEAVADFERLVAEHKYPSEVGAHYGLAYARMRAKDYAGAESELAKARSLSARSPMIEKLAADIKLGRGDVAAAQSIYRDALQRYPFSRALMYGYADTLTTGNQFDRALEFVGAQIQIYPQDDRLYELQAKTYAALGKRTQQHRFQAEVYSLRGQTAMAIEQLMLAQKAGDGNFYEQSVVDARLRELRARRVDEMKRK